MKTLKKLEGAPIRPVLTIVMDGVGLAPASEANAVKLAKTQTLDMLMAKYPMLTLKAHGTAVGLPSDDDMGNSEVGHNALGSGQVFAQGAKLVSNSIESGKMFTSDTWKLLTDNVKENNSTLHFIGLFSDGNVHSHIDHLKAMLVEAKKAGVKTIRVHILLDGRDVGETTALDYIDPFEKFIAELSDENCNIKIASGGGRMVITMDRYEANWHMVELGWKTHVLGEGRYFASAHEAVETYRSETHAIDQDLPPFVIAENGKPVGTINDGDSVVFFNFRPDRAREITRAFCADEFTGFEREKRLDLTYVCFTEYDETIPNKSVAFKKEEITNTFGEYLAAHNMTQARIAETEKYAHVTFFFNGGVEEPNKGEDRILVKSPKVATYDLKPEMSAYEVCDKLTDAIRSQKYDVIIINFANPDMVGHTGVESAAIQAVEAVDECVGKAVDALKEVDGQMFICADHGNAEQLVDYETGEPYTAHTTNPVPFILVNADPSYTLREGGCLADIAPTLIELMGMEQPKEMTGKSLLIKK